MAARVTPPRRRDVVAFIGGVVSLGILLVLAVVVREPTLVQLVLFKVWLGLAAAAVVDAGRGFAGLELPPEIRAGGAVAVFFVVFVFGPPELRLAPRAALPTTGQTVRQERVEAAQGLGGYRSVEMPERARRNLVEADPGAAGVAAYRGSLSAR